MFNGSTGLLRIGGTSATTGTPFPLKYIRFDTYLCTPDQRIDLDSGVSDTTGVLYRNVLGHTRTKIEFKLPMMTEEEYVSNIQNLFDQYWSNAQERKIPIYYYDPQTHAYKQGEFYQPDTAYQIMNVDEANSVITYSEIRVAFIEY